MSVDDYAAESGVDAYQSWYVPDLLPPAGAKLGLLLILESPHKVELDKKLPLVGRAGRTGLEYLLSSASNGALGTYVKAKHDAGDHRIGIMNVSNVPLQKTAYTGRGGPSLTETEWDVLRRVRTSRARGITGTRDADANRVGGLLLTGLQKRLDASVTFDAGATVVAAGGCSQRFSRALHRLPGALLEVWHPSYDQWLNNPTRPAHLALRKLFAINS